MKILMNGLLVITMASVATGRTQMPMQKSQMMQACPMSVRGAEVAAADTTDGIALTFTTKTGNVDELRRNVERMVTMHGNPTAQPSAMSGGMMAGTAKYEPVPDGARLTLTP